VTFSCDSARSEEIPVAADEIQNVPNSNEDETTDGLGIEGILETLSEVFNDVTSTTEEYENMGETTIESGINKHRFTGNENETDPPNEVEPDDSTTDSTTINSSTATVPLITTTTYDEDPTTTEITTTQRPNSCKLTRPAPTNPEVLCSIACSDVPSSQLSNDIRDLLQTELNVSKIFNFDHF
jgi:hypothetical protein